MNLLKQILLLFNFLQKCSSEILQIISKELTYDSELDDLVHTHQNSKFTRVTRKMSRTVTSMTKRIAQRVQRRFVQVTKQRNGLRNGFRLLDSHRSASDRKMLRNEVNLAGNEKRNVARALSQKQSRARCTRSAGHGANVPLSSGPAVRRSKSC